MAHELLFDDDGKACMMYVETPPWHKLGTKLDSPPTAEEAICRANLNWQVTKSPLFYHESQSRTAIVPDRFAVIPGERWIKIERPVFGIVTQRYEILQNQEAFSFFDPLVAQGRATYETAGALGQGERVWVLARIKGEIKVGRDDRVEKYLLLANNHDGKGSVHIKITPVRVVCQNTLAMALKKFGGFQVTHTRDMQKRMELARQILVWQEKLFGDLEQAFSAMTTVKMDSDLLATYLASVFPEPVRPTDNERLGAYEKVRLWTHRSRLGCARIFESVEGPRNLDSAGSLWAGYNSVTEYIDHVRPAGRLGMNENARLNSMWFGKGYATKVRALETAMYLVQNRHN